MAECTHISSIWYMSLDLSSNNRKAYFVRLFGVSRFDLLLMTSAAKWLLGDE